MAASRPVLFSFYRSSCAWRVRIALALKGIDYDCRTLNLLKGEQHQEDFKQQNPQGYVPALLTNNKLLTQSLSILEYLEEAYPDTHPLLPRGCPFKRADVRTLSLMIAADIQPIQNLSVLKRVSEDSGVQNEWGAWVVEKGLDAVEKTLQGYKGAYCVGDDVTMADLCLVPQVFNAHRFGVDLNAFPRVRDVHEALVELDAFQCAHPSTQPDCPPHQVDRLFQRIRK